MINVRVPVPIIRFFRTSFHKIRKTENWNIKIMMGRVTKKGCTCTWWMKLCQNNFQKRNKIIFNQWEDKISDSWPISVLEISSLINDHIITCFSPGIIIIGWTQINIIYFFNSIFFLITNQTQRKMLFFYKFLKTAFPT